MRLPVVSLSKIAPHPDLGGSVFNKYYSLEFALDQISFQDYLSTTKCLFSLPVKFLSFRQDFL